MSRIPTSAQLVAVAFGLAASSCVLFGEQSGTDQSITPQGRAEATTLADGSAAKKTSEQASAARVASSWQTRMLDDLNKGTYEEAYGLFSEGGWSDAGQVWVLVEKDQQRPRLVIVPAGRKEIAVDRTLSESEWKTFWTGISTADQLGDIDQTVFDAVVFEYVHATRKGVQGSAKNSVLDRLYIRSAGVKPLPEHDPVIAAFQNLIPKSP